MRHIVIGDIHGCINMLENLLDAVDLQSTDHIVFLGDLIHKGPSSIQVVNLVQRLVLNKQASLVLGNHEEKHVRWFRQQQSPKTYTQLQHVEEYHEPQNALTKEHIQFIKQNAVTSYAWSNYLAVHGGIPLKLSIDKETLVKKWYELSSRERKALGKVLRVRYETPEGDSVKTKEETPEDIFWADRYDGRYGHVFFGHEAFETLNFPKQFPNATGIDLGAVHGGHLVAAIQQEEKPLRFVMIKAPLKHVAKWSEK